MREETPPPIRKEPTREERLAAKLRENLRRRKVQARDLQGAEVLPKAEPSS